MDLLDMLHGDNNPLLRKFECDEAGCDKAFSRNSDLARHQRIHSNDRFVPLSLEAGTDTKADLSPATGAAAPKLSSSVAP
jgi:uncharacterized Zn-finger protein